MQAPGQYLPYTMIYRFVIFEAIKLVVTTKKSFETEFQLLDCIINCSSLPG